ncbi:hypothetical protein DPMN_057853 [Dreissena polymorpha]|uniref:Reverse transcriptase domain-containing protein n=1 Tax=Dreissena polymorpha TaxID=45954 RepID=A0A9D4C106_DREPO|nr:hypothetical protein DPMN_057853 [Dreissena polymorpha]
MASSLTALTLNEEFDKGYLSHHIQSNTQLNGISLENNKEIKQTLFADDATYFLNDNYESFHNLIESLTLFGITSGLKLNKSKCTVLRVNVINVASRINTLTTFHQDWINIPASTVLTS